MDKNYWLSTKNYLKKFKGFFQSIDEAYEKIYEIIKDSEKIYKIELYKDYEYCNCPIEKIEKKGIYDAFTTFKEDQLIASITLLNLSELNPKYREKIFLSY